MSDYYKSPSDITIEGRMAHTQRRLDHFLENAADYSRRAHRETRKTKINYLETEAQGWMDLYRGDLIIRDRYRVLLGISTREEECNESE